MLFSDASTLDAISAATACGVAMLPQAHRWGAGAPSEGVNIAYLSSNAVGLCHARRRSARRAVHGLAFRHGAPTRLRGIGRRSTCTAPHAPGRFIPWGGWVGCRGGAENDFTLIAAVSQLVELITALCAPGGAPLMSATTLLQNKLWSFLLGAGTAGAAYVSTRVCFRELCTLCMYFW